MRRTSTCSEEQRLLPAKEPTSDPKNVELLATALQDTGRYHYLLLGLFSFTWIAASMNMVMMTFIGHDPPTTNHCEIVRPSEDNAADPILNASSNVAAIFNSNISNPECVLSTNYSGARFGGVIASITIEWDLQGSRHWMVNLAISAYMIGGMIAAPFMGILADTFGRKLILVACLCASLPLNIAIYFMPYFWGFVVLRSVLAVFIQGITGVAFVNCIEFFSARHKMRVIIAFEASWVVGLTLLSLLAFLLSNWRELQLSIMIVTAIPLLYVWWLPESIRWLATKGRHAQLRRVLERAARINRIHLDPQLLILCTGDVGAAPAAAISNRSPTPDAKAKQRHYTSVADIFRTPQMRRRSLVLFFSWFTIATGYFVLTFDVQPLLPNPYLSFLITSSAEYLSVLLNAIISSRGFGRRKPVVTGTVTSGSLCAACGIMASNASGGMLSLVAAITALLGRTVLAYSHQSTFVWTSELFPTVIRGMGLGACNLWMRAGSIVAPQLLLAGRYTWTELPVLVIGVMLCTVGGLMFLLPETVDKALPDTVEDVEGHSPTVMSDSQGALSQSGYV